MIALATVVVDEVVEFVRISVNVSLASVLC